MLRKPDAGWSQITICNWSDRCSYLTDVPCDLLNAIWFCVKWNEPQSVKCDAEGWEYIIVFDLCKTFIIEYNENGDGYRLIDCEIDIEMLAKELVSDIENEIDSWVYWDCDGKSETEINARRTHLLWLCDCILSEIGDDNTIPEQPITIMKGKRRTGRAYRRYQKKSKDARRKDIIRGAGYNPAVGYIEYDYVDGVWTEVGNHIKYPRNSNAQRFLKRLSNKQVRKYAGVIPKGNFYRKIFDYWWELY